MAALWEQFAGVTGADEQASRSFIEASGGSLETAISLFFASSDEPQYGVQSYTDTASTDMVENAPEWLKTVFPATVSASGADAWMRQPLRFTETPVDHYIHSTNVQNIGVGLSQLKNGPCGVLAAVQAVCVARMWSKWHEPTWSIPSDVVVDVITDMIANACPIDFCSSDTDAASAASSPFKVALWATPNAPKISDVSVTEHSTREALRNFISDHFDDSFARPGGIVLLVYSAVLTRGCDRVEQDMAKSGGEAPLVCEPFWICTSDLVALLLRGEADGSVGAYNPVGDNTKVDWPVGLGVGMLSLAELESGIPLADRLKCPLYPVWILHGGDHFTVAWACPREEGGLLPLVGQSGEFDLFHYNGLPPAGPRLSVIGVTAPRGSRPPAPAKHESIYFKPVPGEIESIVQARPEDKKSRPHEWHTWTYEVQLAVDDPDVRGSDRFPEEPFPQTFPQGEPTAGPWRCAKCYAGRFETMCFGMNEDGTNTCEHCLRPRAECGWTLWLHHDALPKNIQNRAARQFAPKLVTLVQTNWPEAVLTFSDIENVPAV